jgi:mannan endo-1,4-beta-mannosidase
MRYLAPILAVFILCASVSAANINITYNVNTDLNRTPISKYIYGSNWGSGTDYTIRRSGGNRLTAYNWENNYSNAGSDYGPYHNDTYMSSSTIPGKAITDFHDQALSQGQASIVTLQMAGYVSADASGNVNIFTESAPSARFKKAVFAKGAPFCSPPGSPVTSDANVYMDEFVNFLVYKYGHAGDPCGVKFYDLDNEPDLWFDFNSTDYPNSWGTHPEVHWQYKAGCAEYKDKSVTLSKAVKNVDPNAQMLGPVSYGFAGYLNFQGAPDWSSVQGSYGWFLSYYLDKMRVDSNSAGKRLLDALDVHWYPEAYDLVSGGHRILDNISTNTMYNARMQAPRTLWDSSYVGNYPNGEISWINQWCSSYLPLIPRLKANIAQYYPDTNLAITEYAYGPDDDPTHGVYSHWSTGIATADVLGIFGKYGVYVATYWGNGTYVDAAIKIYRNYDGAKSKFGDTEVYATDSNKVDSSIYASVFDNNACELHMIVINKNIDNAISGTFNITSPQKFKSGRVWRFNNSSATISETTAISNITGNSFAYTIPATTVCHIVLKTTPTVWDFNGDCRVDLWDLQEFTFSWLAAPDNFDYIDYADFAQDWGI